MDFLPLFFNLNNRPCLIVGGGQIALRKTELLLKAKAQVTIIAPELCPALAKLAATTSINHIAQPFQAELLIPCALIIAATNDSGVNQMVAELAHQRTIPVNVVDQPALCSVIMPSIIDRSPIQIAVSTGGASPVLARLLRARLESTIPAAYGHLAQLVEKFRTPVKQHFKHINARRGFWETVLQGTIAEMVFSGQDQAAERALQTLLNSSPEDSNLPLGEVYLVGAGPGDPDLLTFRALRLIQQADVVVHDRLVSQAVLNMARRDAECIYVGKERANHAVPQEDINQLLINLAQQGKRVCRLKGGDPFIFGRGGEEIQTLASHQIPFQVVPGITAAAGCASYAGIPLTHRDYAQSCVFVTGHLKDNSMDLNWPALAQPQQTVVFYMGLTGLPIICNQLMQHGMPGDTPIALIQKGTTSQQKIFIGTLATMPAKIADQAIHPPTLIVVGQVIHLHPQLAWFEPTPQAPPLDTQQFA